MFLFTATAVIIYFRLVFATPFIDPILLSATQEDYPIDIIVTMRIGTEHILERISAAGINDAAERRTALYEALVENAHESQLDVIDALKAVSSKYSSLTTFWITNQIHIHRAYASVVALLRDHKDVSRVDVEGQVRLHHQARTVDWLAEEPPLEPGWHLHKIRAPELWDKGVTGAGVVVGTISTGVRHTHDILRSSYKNDEYSWFDPVKGSPTPNDVYGVGTYSVGIMVGSERFGVAPGAKWMACKAFHDNELTCESILIRCAEFMLCPVHPDGNQPNCTHAPQVVHNPWFDSNPIYWDMHKKWIAAWHLAGVIPVFAGGAYENGTTGCSSIQFPSTLDDVITVESSDEHDKLWDISGQGPSPVSKRVKPDLVAPGVNVNSSFMSEDSSYFRVSGTTSPAAHVVGVIALLLGQVPTLSYEQLRRILLHTSTRNVHFSCVECGGRSDSHFPNFHFGYGRLDAYAAHECIVAGYQCLEDFVDKASDSCSTSDHVSLWIILGSVLGGTAMVIGAVVGAIRWRSNMRIKGGNYIILQTIQKFRDGVWPPEFLPDGTRPCTHEDEEHEVQRNLAFASSYDVGRHEISTGDLNIPLGSSELGSGEFGVVYRGSYHKSGCNMRYVAVKKLKAGFDAESVALFLKELKITIYVGVHENIVKFVGACTAEPEKLCIVLELCTNGSLKKYLRGHRATFRDLVCGNRFLPRYSDSPLRSYVQMANNSRPVPLSPMDSYDLLKWIVQIATGMEFLAEKHIIHGDLACRNVLLDENLTAKISDFGLASRLYQHAKYVRTEQKLLPWQWMAIESLQDMRFSHASDVWAFGITAWEVFTLAQVPYPGCTWGAPFMKQLLRGYRNERPGFATDEIYAIIQSCWRQECDERPTITSVKCSISAICAEI